MINNFLKKFHLTRANTFKCAFFSILLLTSFNAIFNSMSVALGGNVNASTFLMLPVDLFGDYFKAIFSFANPGDFDTKLPGFDNLSNILHRYLHENGYKIIDQNTGLPKNLHGMPFSTLFGLVNIFFMKWINPFYLFCLNIIGVLFLYCVIARSVTKITVDRFYLIGAVVFSYPILFMFVRGHLISSFSTLAIIFYVIYLRDGRINLAVTYLALACSFKPNCIIFIALLLTVINNNIFKFFIINSIKFSLIFSLTFIISLYIDGLLHPLYTFDNFITALNMYSSLYMVGNSGLNYGSSFLGAVKMIFGYSPDTELIILFGLFIIFIFSVYRYLTSRININSFLFIICAIYCLYTPVFADYYLIIFILPIMFLGLTTDFSINSKLERFVIFTCCVLVLSPKNYFFIESTSYQVILNPLILLFGMLLILTLSKRYSRVSLGQKPC